MNIIPEKKLFINPFRKYVRDKHIIISIRIAPRRGALRASGTRLARTESGDETRSNRKDPDYLRTFESTCRTKKHIGITYNASAAEMKRK